MVALRVLPSARVAIHSTSQLGRSTLHVALPICMLLGRDDSIVQEENYWIGHFGRQNPSW